MKKLKLIIPLVHIPKSRFVIYVIILLLGSSSIVRAVDVYGCHIIAGSQDRLYYLPYTIGAGSPSEWISNSAGGGGFNTLTASRCLDDSWTSCVVYRFGTTSTVHPLPPASDPEVFYEGVYSRLYDCPLDNHISILFLLMGSFGFFIVKRKTLA